MHMSAYTVQLESEHLFKPEVVNRTHYNLEKIQVLEDDTTMIKSVWLFNLLQKLYINVETNNIPGVWGWGADSNRKPITYIDMIQYIHDIVLDMKSNCFNRRLEKSEQWKPVISANIQKGNIFYITVQIDLDYGSLLL